MQPVVTACVLDAPCHSTSNVALILMPPRGLICLCLLASRSICSAQAAHTGAASIMVLLS